MHYFHIRELVHFLYFQVQFCREYCINLLTVDKKNNILAKMLLSRKSCGFDLYFSPNNFTHAPVYSSENHSIFFHQWVSFVSSMGNSEIKKLKKRTFSWKQRHGLYKNTEVKHSKNVYFGAPISPQFHNRFVSHHVNPNFNIIDR